MAEQLFIKNVPHGEVVNLASLVNYEAHRLVSLTLVQRDDLSVTLFAVDGGERIATHSAPGDAMATILDGSVEITVGETPHTVAAGQSIVMPAGIPHALKAHEAFKMLLVLVKPSKA